MTERFYLPSDFTRKEVELSGSEAHHMLHVLRLREGAAVILFDGRGTEAEAIIVQRGRASVHLHITSIRETTPECASQVVLATAVPKGDRLRWLVEKTTELGVAELIPLKTSHSVVVPGPGKLTRLDQTVIAACKQSGRNTLMVVSPVMSWDEFLASRIEGMTFLVAHPGGRQFSAGLAEEVLNPDNAAVVAVGPEGGFDDDEIRRAVDAGASLVSLGPRILRIETAGIVLAALLMSSEAGSRTTTSCRSVDKT